MIVHQITVIISLFSIYFIRLLICLDYDYGSDSISSIYQGSPFVMYDGFIALLMLFPIVLDENGGCVF